jgi:hypothetical protein
MRYRFGVEWPLDDDSKMLFMSGLEEMYSIMLQIAVMIHPNAMVDHNRWAAKIGTSASAGLHSVLVKLPIPLLPVLVCIIASYVF